MKNFRCWARSAVLCSAVLGLSAIPWISAVKADDESQCLPNMFRCGESFAASLSAGDMTALASVTHPSLLARIQIPPEAANRRTYECLSFGPFVATSAGPTYGTLLLLARHPDGVEDLVTVTLRSDAGQWRVVGGPVGHTRPNPLDD